MFCKARVSLPVALTLPSRESGERHARRQAGRVQSVPGVDVGQLHGGGAAVPGAGPVQGQGGGHKLNGMVQGLLIPGHLEKFIRPFQNVLISQLSPDLIGMGTAIGEGVAAGFTVLAEPEPDCVGRRLPGLILRKSVRRVAGVAKHEDGLKPRKGVRTEYRGRWCGGVRSAMGIAGGMLNTVADLTGGLDPVAGRIQILPATVAVILEIVKGAVCLALDRYALGEGVVRMGGTQGHERKQAEQTHTECQDAGDNSVHFFFPFL